MLKAIQQERTNQIVTPKQRLPYRTIDAMLVGTVRNTVYVKLDQIFPIHVGQVVIVMVQTLPTATMTIMAETDIVKIDAVIVRPLFIGVGVKEMTIIESILMTENGVTMITTTTEAVRGVIAEAEKEIALVYGIKKRNIVGIDLETDTKRVERDLEKDTEIDLDRGKDLMKDPGIGIGTVVDPGTDLEIERDPVIEEKGTVKTIGLVDAVAKVLTMGIMTAQTKEGSHTVASIQKLSSQTMNLMNEHMSLGDAGAVVEAENGVERIGEGNVAFEVEADLQDRKSVV